MKKKSKSKDIVCPRCGHFIPNDDSPGAYPGALSRRDNMTEICSDCGTAEAFEDFLQVQYRGSVYWNPVKVKP